jgi:hypothetical protein
MIRKFVGDDEMGEAAWGIDGRLVSISASVAKPK